MKESRTLSYLAKIEKESRYSFMLSRDRQKFQITKTELINLMSFMIDVVLGEEELNTFYLKLQTKTRDNVYKK